MKRFSKKQIARDLGLAAAFALAIYSNSFRSGFHFDDMKGVLHNPFIRDLGAVRTIWDAFGTRVVFGYTLAMNYAMGGSNVVVYHATNFAVHVLAAVCLYFFVRVTLQTPRIRGHAGLQARSREIALCSALLFLAHPIQTQAVNYVWQRSACLAALFYLLSMCLYARARLGSKASYALLFPAMLLAMFSKETSFTLPVAICAYEFFFFDGRDANLKNRAKFLVPVLSMLAVIPLAYYLHSSHIILSVMRPGTLAGGASHLDIGRFVSEDIMSRQQYLLTQLNVLRTYLRLLFFPVGLNLDHDYPISSSLFEMKTLASALLLLSIAAAGTWAYRRNRYLSFSVLWFFLALSVESWVVQKDVIFEHRLYLPMAAFSLLAPAAAFLALKNARVALAALLSVTLVFGGMTYQRNKVWATEETLWQDVVSKSPNKPGGYNSLALHYQMNGEVDRAIPYYQKAIEVSRKSSFVNLAVLAQTYSNLGIIYYLRGDLSGAIRNYHEALKANPGDSHVHLNLGVAYGNRGETAKELEHYEKAIELDPMYAEAHNNLGAIFLDRGDAARAIPHFEKAVKINPAYADAIYSLGLAYLKQGDPAAAKHQRDKLKKLGNNELAGRLEKKIGAAAISSN